MAIRLNAPPIREKMLDENGMVTKNWASYLMQHYAKTGGESPVLPVSLGGSGASSVVGALAIQTASASSGGSSGGGTSSSAVTQRQTFSLNSPLGEPGSTADTNVLWDTPFADANYTVTADFSSPSRGEITVSNITAAGFTITLEQTTDKPASGTADCIGIHA